MKRYLHIIYILGLLLMVGSAINEAWGKITYHILSLPFDTYQRDGTDFIQGSTISIFRSNVRVEAFCCWDNDQVVGLPNEYKSPLISDANYHYYYSSSITKSANPEKLYGYTNSTYYFYNINGSTGNPADNRTNADYSTEYVAVGTELEGDVDIYVTYTYDPDDAGASMHMDLSATRDYTGDGLLSSSQEYNIRLRDRMLVLNQNRQNRPGAVLDGFYTEEDLVSDEFRWIEGGGLNGVDGYRFFKFQFGGNDPYNVTLYTAYNKSTTFRKKEKNNVAFERNGTQNDYDKYIGTGKNVYKEYRGASFFAKLSGGVVDGNNMWLSSEADLQWTDIWSGSDNDKKDNATIKVVPGYFKGPNDNKSTKYEMSPIFNSFAILNHKSGGYVLAASKMNVGNNNSTVNNWQPRSSDGAIQYLDYDGNGNNIKLIYRKPSDTPSGIIPYEIKEYTFIVKTPFGSILSDKGIWSDAFEDDAIQEEHVPNSLRRKYCSVVGFYKDNDPSKTITKYSDVPEDGNIYVKYEVSGMPFTAINPNVVASDTTWYELTDAGSSQSDGKKLRWDGSSNFKNNGANEVYEKESEFAFIGDPYELRVISRSQTWRTVSGVSYVGAAGATPASGTALTASTSATAGYKWEIPADDIDGSILLRKFNDEGHWYWDTSLSNQNVSYSTSDATRVKVMALPKLNYTFKVVDLAGRIAIQAVEAYLPFTQLTGYANIPASIRSPFLADETVTFHNSYDGSGRGNLTNLNKIEELPGTASTIWVKYTTENLDSKQIKLKFTQVFNVKLNNRYIYWNGSKILSSEDLPDTSGMTEEDKTAAENPYTWRLRGRDPYAMMIENVQATEDAGFDPTNETIDVYNPSGDGSKDDSESVPRGKYVKVTTWGNGQSFSFDERANCTPFVAMMSNNVGVYEVLVDKGDGTYYHIGRITGTETETKLYSIDTEEGGYAHGADELRFELFGSSETTYTLIDREGTELINVKTKNPRLALPSDYVSPLVTEYYYYKTKEEANAYRTAGTVGTRITEIDQDPDGHVWVVYDEVTNFFGSSHQYMLKFRNGQSYKLEDGADKLTGTKIQAMYPYFNGDGNLNIYGEAMNEEQMAGGSSTRPRWVWYIESNNNDPYHVKIRSRQSISFNGSNNGYIQTQAVHFNQDANANTQHIITGCNLYGITSTPVTEYMILGTTGRYKLLTTNKIKADLNGDGDTTDDGENERQYVTSFEQYWKTYNMIKQHVLGILESEDGFSDDPATYVVPADKRETLKTKLDDLEIGGDNWHSYNAVANAVRWNGYNDKDTGHKSKKVERLEHWFQTFDMGNGEFDIESANIPSALILLDRHGWEIMRKPIPTESGDADAPTKLAALRAYDSPMVKEYKFYSNADKVSNCHKYELRMQNGAERDPIMVNGKQFTSTSLATLPAYKEDQDLYVTYTVKEEYDKSYTYSLDYTKNDDGSYTINSESGTASAFIVLQDHKYASDEGSSSISKTTAPTSLSNEIIADADKAEGSKAFKQQTLWYVQPNLDIDNEMGISWPWKLPGSETLHEEAETKVLYKDKTGFDPYNIQLKNASTNKFFTIGMTKSILENGQYKGDYTGSNTNVTLAAENTEHPVISPESYDHSELKMTNQTFMAVQDVNGNMQLMPRFDHNTRIDAFATLETPKRRSPKASVDDSDMGEQTTFMVLPVVYDYHIIDNDGQTAMRYKTGGEFYPSMPEHFKSPLAKNFKYYFGHAVYTTAESTKDDYDVASEGFKKTATNESNMHTQAMALTTGEYYYRIGSSNYTYKKVTVTKDNTTTTSDGIYEEIIDKTDISDREITGSFAASGIRTSSNIYIRYEYDETSDTDHDYVLQGRWMTMSLAGKDAQYSGTLNADGSGIYTGTKPTESETPPAKNLSDAYQWHWKFRQSPCVPTSDYYIAPDPYSVRISNREANNDLPTSDPNKMSIGIKVNDIDRFVILSHPSGDYAFAAAGDGLSYSFLNGGSMTTPSTTPASIASEAGFTTSSNTISANARVIFTNEVNHNFTYNIITNDGFLAAYEDQDMVTAQGNSFIPVLPDAIQTPLLNMDDYLYYGTAIINDKETVDTSDDEYTIDTKSQIDNLYGLYEDVIYVHYEFNSDKTPYLVPNKRTTVDSKVAVDGESNPVVIDISGKLPYNIIWYNDNMMGASGSSISDGGIMDLTGNSSYTWYFEGGDPYALKIKKGTDLYVDGTGTLSATAKEFMLLKKDGYDYGVFAEKGNRTNMLSFGPANATHTMSLSPSDPVKFIPFALSTHQLVYHLVINTSNVNTTIPYRSGTEDEPGDDLIYLDIPGTTQRDLTSKTNGVAGDKYQLGHTYMGKTYCVDAGQVSIGDKLEVPSEFDRPNCLYFYYIDNIQTKPGIPTDYQKTVVDVSAMETDAESLSTGAYYYYNVGSGSAYYRAHKESSGAIIVACTVGEYNNAWQDDEYLNNLYKGLNVEKLMSKSELVGSVVNVNIAYGFNTGLGTNAGDGFVTSLTQNRWYTFETAGSTPYLAHYTNALGLKAMEGRDTRYTNDYLWTPLGDVYGFKMYNRYVKKNSKTDGDDDTRVMTTDNATFSSVVNLKMAVPGVDGVPSGNEVYELLAEASTTPGYFLIHPVINNSGTKYYIKKDVSDDYTKLDVRANATEWTFGLSPDLIQPYFDRVDYIGGLKSDVANSTSFVVDDKTVNVKDLSTALKNGTATVAQLMTLQSIVYNTDNIVPFSSGYYRLHNQPDVSGIAPVRYASGYLHDIERTQEKGFYQKTATDASDMVSESNLLAQIGDYYFKVGGSAYYKVTVTKAYDGSTNATHNAASLDSENSNASEWNAAGGLPMHFYSKVGIKTTFAGDGGLGSGFTESEATCGAIPVPATEYDPSTIFYLSGSKCTNPTISNATMSTQGLNVVENRMTTSTGTTFTLMDIGGAVYLITDILNPATRKYLNYDQSYEKSSVKMIYDLKFYHEPPTDDAKWCIEPANNQGLMIETHDGKEGFFYSTFCAPFDVAMPDDAGSNNFYAYVCNAWDTEVIYPKRVPEKTIGLKNYAEGEFVPAGTPVILRTTDNTGKFKLTLPTDAPTTPAVSCVFSGKYLEQLLETAISSSDKVYTFGLPITGYGLYVGADDMGTNKLNGDITDYVEGTPVENGVVGFYINANHNKERSGISGEWTPNNRYVLHNKIFYRAGSSGSNAKSRKVANMPQFVPVIFDDELEDEELQEEEQGQPQMQEYGDGVYDLSGRKVANEEQVQDGTWRQRLSPGIYIVQGKKIKI